MATHSCMQQIHLLAIKHLTILILNKKKLESCQRYITHLSPIYSQTISRILIVTTSLIAK